jgi:hypothetical protein
MIVDDRVVIMGSANINERSQLGVRDSEIAACIEDDTLISSTLNGKKVKVSKFAHTLRMRLMSEHIGLDVDRMDVEKYQGIKKKNGYFKEPAFKDFSDKAHIDCVPQFVKVASEPIPKKKNLFFDDEKPKNNVELNEAMLSPTKLSATSSPSNNSSAQNSATSEKSDLTHTMSLFNKRKSLNQEEIATFWLSLDCDTDNNDDTKGSTQPLDYYNELGLDELMEKIRASKMTVADVYQLLIDPMKDDFYRFWHIIARANALIYRRVFLVFPDNNVRTWEQYTHFNKMSKLLLGRQDIKHGGTSNTTAAANVCPQDPEGTLHAWLHKIQGQLVIWPTHFLEEADAKNEFLSNVDKIVPVEIFN